MVGCRNRELEGVDGAVESIKRSGGGVSEPRSAVFAGRVGVYQAFRWWGVGTISEAHCVLRKSLSSVPVVGCRNQASTHQWFSYESIKRSGGGVSELIGS